MTRAKRPPLFRAVDCLRIPVPDLDAGLRFYRDELGHELLWRSPTAAGLRIPKGGAELVIHIESARGETDLLVDSVPRAIRRVTRAGGKLLDGPIDIPVGRVAFLADPWGNPLAILDLSKGRLRVDREKRVSGVRQRAKNQIKSAARTAAKQANANIPRRSDRDRERIG